VNNAFSCEGHCSVKETLFPFCFSAVQHTFAADKNQDQYLLDWQNIEKYQVWFRLNGTRYQHQYFTIMFNWKKNIYILFYPNKFLPERKTHLSDFPQTTSGKAPESSSVFLISSKIV